MLTLPVEVGAWLQRLPGMAAGDWVLVQSASEQLPVGLSVRGAVPCNVV